jgi:predicted amidohydrolase
MRIAIGQMKVAALDRPGDNMPEACSLARQAAAGGARLLILPEGCLTGNALSRAERQPSMPAEPGALEPLTAIAWETGLTICAGFATPFDGMFNLVHAVIPPEGPVLFQHKAARASTEPPFIKAWPDPVRVPFVVDGMTVVIAICSEFANSAVMAEVRRCKPDLLLHPSAGSMKPEEVWTPASAGTPPVLEFRTKSRRVVDRAAAGNIEMGIPRAGANPVGFDGETWWPGNCYALGSGTEVLCWVEGENRPEHQVSRLGFADIPEKGSTPSAS